MKAIALVVVQKGTAQAYTPRHVDCRVVDLDTDDAHNLPAGQGFEALVQQAGISAKIKWASPQRALEHGYICAQCASKRGGIWPEGHVATMHSGYCPQCLQQRVLASVGDYDWPPGAVRPAISAGRD